jgi:CoA:oxalate CoA-transferase
MSTLRLPMLRGYRVLDLTQIVAGPTCTRILAEAGADVVKVELAPFGDRTRFSGLKPQKVTSSQSTFYFQHNHSKRSLALDFKSPRGLALIKRLLPKFDVLVENFSPGVMLRAGLSYDEIVSVNPKIIMCSISLAGQSGPLAAKPGYDYIAQAYSGIGDLIGDADGPPALPGMAIGDTATGIAAAMAIGFALLHRERTGEGQYIDTSLIDTYFSMHEAALPRVSLRKNHEPRRSGSQHPDGGPTGLFRCGAHGYVALAVLPHQWEAFVFALGMPELLADPRFANAVLRRNNNHDLVTILEQWLGAFESRDAALGRLDEFRIPCAPVLSLSQAMHHPHLQARGTVRRVRDPLLGSFDIPGPLIRYSGWAPEQDVHADLLGEHNSEVLKELLGMSEEEVDCLHADKVLVRDPMLLQT